MKKVIIAKNWMNGSGIIIMSNLQFGNIGKKVYLAITAITDGWNTILKAGGLKYLKIIGEKFLITMIPANWLILKNDTKIS